MMLRLALGALLLALAGLDLANGAPDLPLTIAGFAVGVALLITVSLDLLRFARGRA